VIAETCSLNYHLKSLDPQSDNLSNYLSWIKDTKNNRFIESVNNQFTHQDLVSYIDNKNESDNAILFGIFSKLDGFHIGNVKLEPLIISQYAWLGILIGEAEFRGRGVGFEVISHLLHFSGRYLNLNNVGNLVLFFNLQNYSLKIKYLYGKPYLFNRFLIRNLHFCTVLYS
jgi:RimJ/RimL family protein N-acetyltransferase